MTAPRPDADRRAPVVDLALWRQEREVADAERRLVRGMVVGLVIAGPVWAVFILAGWMIASNWWQWGQVHP
jgi:hypothetical protein